MADKEWTSQFESELQTAQEARTAGNEGKARVCARRAAGVVVGEYFRQQGLPASEQNAYDRLRLLQTIPGLPAEIYPVVEHFLVRVTPEHTLPVEADLIADAHWLKSVLINTPTNSPG